MKMEGLQRTPKVVLEGGYETFEYFIIFLLY